MAIIASGTNTDEALVSNQGLKVFIADSLGNEVTPSAGVRDLGNSTVAPLAANGVFVGAGFELTKYRSIILTITTPQSSAASGVELQGSFDNSTWEVWRSFSFTGSAIAQSFQFYVPFKFFRLRFVNGVTLQTTFKLDVVCSLSAPFPAMPASQIVKHEDNQQEFVTIRNFQSLISPSGAVNNRRNTISIQNRPALSAGLAAVGIIATPGGTARLYIHRMTIKAYTTTAAATAAATTITWSANGDLGAQVHTVECPTLAFTARETTVIDAQIAPIGLNTNTAFTVTVPAVTNVGYEINVTYHIGGV